MRHEIPENSSINSLVAKNPLAGQPPLRVIAFSENYAVLDSIKTILADVMVETCTSGKELMLNCAMDPYPNMILLDGCLEEVKASPLYRQLMSNPLTRQIPVCCFKQPATDKIGLNCDSVCFVSEWNDSGRYSENFSKTSAFLFTHS